MSTDFVPEEHGGAEEVYEEGHCEPVVGVSVAHEEYAANDGNYEERLSARMIIRLEGSTRSTVGKEIVCEDFDMAVRSQSTDDEAKMRIEDVDTLEEKIVADEDAE